MSKPDVAQKSTSQPATAKDTAKQLLWFNARTSLAGANDTICQPINSEQISGSIGTVLFFIVYQLMFHLAPFDYHRASICWTASYLLSICKYSLNSNVLLIIFSVQYGSIGCIVYLYLGLKVCLSILH